MAGNGGGGGAGAKSFDRENAWSSLNHSMLSSTDHRGRMHASFRAGTQVNYKTIINLKGGILQLET
jgi:hypothetical protein